MTQRQHAQEAQLEPGMRRHGWIVQDHGDRHDGEDRVAVPVPSHRRARCAEHRHPRRAHGARGWRHDAEGREGDDRDHDGLPACVADDEARRRRGHPGEHGEVEAGDREDVREPDRAEVVLHRAVAALGVAEDKRDHHRAHGVVLGRSVRHARDKRGTHAVPHRLAELEDRIRRRTGRPPAGDRPSERCRLDRQCADYAAPTERFGRIARARHDGSRDRAQARGQFEARSDRPPGIRLRHAREQHERVVDGPLCAGFVEEDEARRINVRDLFLPAAALLSDIGPTLFCGAHTLFFSVNPIRLRV